MMEAIISCVGIAWYSFLWTVNVTALYVSRTRYKGTTSASPLASLSPDQVPGVTILRPLRGVDSNLYGNLECSFLQDYPRIEIIFSVAEKTDEAIQVVKDLMAAYPNVDAKLLIGDEAVGINPKINNLIRGYRSARYDILWITDSNVLISTGSLSKSVSLLTQSTPPGQQKVGLINHLALGIYPGKSLGSQTESAYLTTAFVKLALAMKSTEAVSCVTGKSCVFRKSDLELATKKRWPEITSLADGEALAAYGRYLGEDNLIGESIWYQLGLRHELGTDIAGNFIGSVKLSDYAHRRIRWGRARKYMVPLFTALEPIMDSLVLGCLVSLAVERLFAIPKLLFLSIHFGFWFLSDWLLFSSLLGVAPTQKNKPHSMPGFNFMAGWLFREITVLPIYLYTMCGNTVKWRDNGEVYRVCTDSTVVLA